jgi:hypothetical protein
MCSCPLAVIFPGFGALGGLEALSFVLAGALGTFGSLGMEDRRLRALELSGGPSPAIVGMSCGVMASHTFRKL